MPKTIVITGATNGIGLAAALGLAGLGENVVIVGRNDTRVRIVAAQVKAAGGSEGDGGNAHRRSLLAGRRTQARSGKFSTAIPSCTFS